MIFCNFLSQSEKSGFIVSLTKGFFSLILTYVLMLRAKIIKNGTSEKKSGRQKLGENTGLSRSKRDVWSPYFFGAYEKTKLG